MASMRSREPAERRREFHPVRRPTRCVRESLRSSVRAPPSASDISPGNRAVAQPGARPVRSRWNKDRASSSLNHAEGLHHVEAIVAIPAPDPAGMPPRQLLDSRNDLPPNPR